MDKEHNTFIYPEEKNMSHPLLCWDIVLESFHQRMHYQYDLECIQIIQEKNGWQNLAVLPDSALIWENKIIVITNTSLIIEHVTQNIYAMNGYLPKEVIGKSPKMFQGKETSLDTRRQIKLAITKPTPFNASIANYRKDGSLYMCQIEAYPIFNEQGKLVNFIAFEQAA
ncbi:MAG TPA: PAS domain-containing protein [Phnomibacter sp.]|nr:PAS domain-containing protein [Phnomibacter sp.]